uniref:Uncharacterized protein n=1 Tax=Xenopus tropicalis TaxID=8364 RepID=A0A6I8SZB8_XENTR
MDLTTMDSHHYGCKPLRLGGNFPPTHMSRDMDGRGGETANQRPGNQGHTKRHLSLVPTLHRPAPARTVGQCHCGCLHQQAGRHPQQPSHARGIHDTQLGRITRPGTVSRLHTRRPELGGGLPQSTTDRSRGVGTPPGHFRPNRGQMGMPGHRHASIQAQLQSSYVLRQVTGPGGVIRGCLSHTVDFQQSLCVSSARSLTSNNTQDSTGTHSDNSNCPRLAQADLVCGPCDNVDSSTIATTSQTGFTDPRSNQTRESSNATFDGLAIETDLWRAKGFSNSAIDILLKARKPTTTKVYYRTWKAFMDHSASTHMPWQQASTQTIIEFLAKGFHLGLSLATLKSQISALSLLLQHHWARESDVAQFLQGVGRTRPPYRDPTPPWDLNLVLTALQGPPFEPLGVCDLKFLTWKVTFLIAIASAKRVSDIAALSHIEPWLVIHQDRAVFRTVPSFTPKVVSPFHINEEINLPSLCPRPTNAKEKALHKLDVVRAIRFYLDRSKSYRKADAFLVTYGANKGSAASKRTIARWLVNTINYAYDLKKQPKPFRVKAHSTRAVSTSWALYNSATAEQICKAATWASLSTFAKFYRLQVFHSAPAAFGRKVLQAAVQH